MKLILNDFVAHLGSPGDEVDVAPGYARNYLLPKKLAFAATGSAKKTFENNLKQRARKVVKFLNEAEEQKKSLESLEPLSFTRKVGEAGKLFGSVTSADIEEALKERGYSVEKKQIELKQPIKSIVETAVIVKLHQKVVAKVKVAVIGEKAEVEAEEEYIPMVGEEVKATESSEEAEATEESDQAEDEVVVDKSLTEEN